MRNLHGFNTHSDVTRRTKIGLVSILSISLIGSVIIALSHATAPTAYLEPDNDHPGGNAVLVGDLTASKGAYLKFGPTIPFGGASPGGTYADWYYPGSGLSSIEWTAVPLQDPVQSLTTDNLLHYYAYTFGLNNQNSTVGFGYAGFQTNGLFSGVFRGKSINFSFWASNGGKTQGPGLLEANNPENGGYRILYPFNWVVSHRYRFQLKPGPSGVDAQGKWWGLWVTDQNLATTTYIGEERMPVAINGVDSTLLQTHTGAFGEDVHWWRSLEGNTKYLCSDFQKSSMAYTNISGNNGSIVPNNFNAFTNSLQPSTGPSTGYKTTNCVVSVYSNVSDDVQMNLGYWSPAAVDYTRSLP